jgi:hypothetical protein
MKNKNKILKAIYLADYIPDVMEKIEESLLDDKDIIDYAVGIDGCALEYASDSLKNDKDVVLKAVNNDGSALSYASDNLKDDKEVVMTALKNDGWALSDASDSLKSDKEVCLQAVITSGDAVIDDIGDSLKRDKDIITAIENFKDDFDFDDSEGEREKPPGWVEPIHRYRIDTAQWSQGGEFVCGKVSAEFVKYWAPVIAQEGNERLTNHMLGLDGYDGPVDTDSPKVVETDGDWDTPYHELEAIEHFTSANSDQEFRVTEITGEGDDFIDNDEKIQKGVTGNCIYSREGAIIRLEEPQVTEHISKDDLRDFIPVLLFHNIDKGDFGSWFIGTDKDGFDSSKLSYNQVETELGVFIERVWYDQEELIKNDEYASSSPKETTSTVGWLNMKYLDSAEKYTDEYINENEFFKNG